MGNALACVNDDKEEEARKAHAPSSKDLQSGADSMERTLSPAERDEIQKKKMREKVKLEELTDKLRKLYMDLDVDGDGAMDEFAFFEVLKKLGQRKPDGGEWDEAENKKAFLLMDQDNDGHVTKNEFVVYYRDFLRQAHVHSETDDEQFLKLVAQMIAHADEFKKGVVTKRTKLEIRKAKLGTVFSAWDRDGNSKINRHELHLVGYVMHDGNWTSEQTDLLLKTWDKNGDGMVSLDEFFEFYQQVLYFADDDTFDRGLQMFIKVGEVSHAQEVLEKKRINEQAEDAAAREAVKTAEGEVAAATTDEEKEVAELKLKVAQDRLKVEIEETNTLAEKEKMAEEAEEMVHNAVDKLAALEKELAEEDRQVALQHAQAEAQKAKESGNEIEAMIADATAKNLQGQ
jgi:Ca2+-binding EF-hand superfamily protein